MSPEQAASETIHGRSDLYCLGVVGYSALSGRLPIDGSTAAVARRQRRAWAQAKDPARGLYLATSAF